jgi:CBS domain-containing protein
MQLREIMTHDVHAVPPDASLRRAAQEMQACDVGALPVCMGDKLVGIITDRDIATRGVAEGKDPSSCPVSEAMTPELIYCFSDEDVQRAVELMEFKQIRRLPVMDRNTMRLVGIVSLGDLATRRRDERLSGEVLQQVSQPTWHS